MNKNTLALRQIMAFNGLNCEKVANLIFRKKETIRKYRTGERQISDDLLEALKMKVSLQHDNKIHN